jgi:hypothetical protein
MAMVGFLVPDQVAVPADSRAAPWCLERGGRLARRGVPRTPPHPQSAEDKRAEEHDNADEQQEQQALGDDADDAQYDRHDHEEQEEGKHLILRSVVVLSGGPTAAHRWRLPGTAGRSA